ncbi:aminoglycoside phosphotransferase family protein, partial [Polaromonas sp. P5_E6]
MSVSRNEVAVTENSSEVVKVYTDKRSGLIELAVLKLLEKTGLAPSVLQVTTRADYCEVTMQKISGHTLDQLAQERSFHLPQACYQLGRSVRELHEISIRELPSVTLPVRDEAYAAKLSKLLLTDSALMIANSIAAEAYKEPDGELCFLHRDISLKNAIYDPISEKCFLLDFENAAIGVSHTDVWRFLEVEATELPRNCLELFCAGYELNQDAYKKWKKLSALMFVLEFALF